MRFRSVLPMLFGLTALISSTACGRDDGLDKPKATVDLSPKHLAPTDKVEAPIELERKAPARDDRYEQRVEEARRTVDITLYGASWCPSCKQTRAWLDANGMAYNERDIDSSEDASRAARRLNPKGTIPVIDVEGDVVVGFAPQAVDRAIRRRAELRVKMN